MLDQAKLRQRPFCQTFPDILNGGKSFIPEKGVAKYNLYLLSGSERLDER